MYSNRIISEVKLDQEWLDLITEAKKAGLTITEIRDFLKDEARIQAMQQEVRVKNAL